MFLQQEAKQSVLQVLYKYRVLLLSYSKERKDNLAVYFIEGLYTQFLQVHNGLGLLYLDCQFRLAAGDGFPGNVSV